MKGKVMAELFRNSNDNVLKSWVDGKTPTPILAAEPTLAGARNLVQCLSGLRLPVRLAMSSSDIIDLLRREVFTRAVVASEFMIDGEPAIARLTRLPMLERVVAIGPAGNADLEMQARRAGAQAYLTRPVSAESLARALAIPGLVAARR
jgi:CheY-like chemotaxis protein